jgi:hypothetical protein
MNAKILLENDKTLVLIIDYPRKKHNKQTSGIINIKLNDEDYRQLKVLMEKTTMRF